MTTLKTLRNAAEFAIECGHPRIFVDPVFLIQLVTTIDEMAAALRDAQYGLDYIRQFHGVLYGVGFDRCEKKSTKALAKYNELNNENGE